ncbi:hypothetical protein AB0D10_38130 [Kitasatospora sp. NPDC048545]|uniref:hypothetical protein n=1 Tax=Kitasatospora sp. NPDC048545 TaxID=3157208 RepID=UPI0033CDE42C
MTTTATAGTTRATDWPANVLTRYVNLGGAHVDLITRRFATRYTWQGRPYVGDEAREVDGFVWECRGCDTRGGYGYDREPYLPNERGEATAAANDHASACRAIPRPTR